MSIRSKLALFVIPLVLFPLSIVGFFSFQLMSGGFHTQAYLADQQLCMTVAQRIEQYLDNCQSSLLLVSSILSNRLEETGAKSIEALLRNEGNPAEDIARALALRYSPYLKIRVTAPDGKEIFVAEGDTRKSEMGSALNESFFFQSVSVSGQFPPVKKGPDGSWVTTFSSSLVSGQTLLGFVYFDLNLDAVAKILRDRAGERPGYYFLFDGGGTTLAEAGTITLTDLGPVHQNFRTVLQHMRENPRPTFTHYPDRVGEHTAFLSVQPVKEYISFREPIPQDRWYLGLVHIDTPLFLAFQQSSIVFWVVLGAGLVIAIFGTFYISNALTTPLLQLTNAARAFARGRLDSRVKATGGDEIGRLSVDFNTMAEKIEHLITERKRSEEEIRGSREQLRALSARIESIREDEKTRMAREIHDQLGQALTALKMDLSVVGRKIGEGSDTRMEPLLEKLNSMSNLIDSTTELIYRIAKDLRPDILDNLGLTEAIEWYIEEFQSRTGIRCVPKIKQDHEMSSQSVSTAVFRILQETLTNVARHSKADGVEILLHITKEMLTLKVHDNGCGITNVQITDRKSLGLLGMGERARLLGGTLMIDGAPGRGTTVSVSIPLVDSVGEDR